MAKSWQQSLLSSSLPLENDVKRYLDSKGCITGYEYSYLKPDETKIAGIRTIEILGASDGNVCSSCVQIDGQKYKIEEVPEIPYPKCTSEIGWRCTAVTGDI